MSYRSANAEREQTAVILAFLQSRPEGLSAKEVSTLVHQLQSGDVPPVPTGEEPACERFEQVMNAFDGAFWLYEDGQLTYTNERFTSTLGLQPEDLRANPHALLQKVHPEDREASARLFEPIYADSKERLSTETRLMREGQDPLWVLLARKVARKDGHPVRVSWIARDITARKESEIQLRSAKRESDALNMELSAINDQMELAIARANEMALEAESASRSKTEFLANMSHEIRTPLNAIMGMLTMIEDSHLSPDQRDCVETMRDASDSLLNIINDILDFSKIEAGRIELETIPFDLHKLLQDTRNMLLIRARQKHLELNVEIDPTAPRFVIGDPTRLRQILLNLLGNALKFTEQGSVSFSLKPLEGGAEDEHKVALAISDTGIGIPRNRMDRLFRPFTQVDASTTREFGGTGLGLAISKRLCNLMEGEMSVESEVSVGTTFHFTAVVAADPEAEEKARAAASQRPARSPFEQSNARKDLRILLAEDNPTNQKVALMLLKRCGYTADVALNGKEALDQCRDQNFDVILMDMQMPVMDGLESTRRIRAELPEDQQPYVIALTASASKQHRDMCIDSGMDTFLSKPFRIEELLDALAGATRVEC